MFKTSELYLANLNATEDIVINQGGTSSGKTYSIMQVAFTKCISEPNRVFTVVGQDIPNLKVGAMRDAETIIDGSEELKSCIQSHNKTDRIYQFKSGSVLEFKSFSDEVDARSGKRDYSFFNEVNGIPKAIFQQVELRTKIRTWMDYNPSEEFWAHTDYIGKPNVKFLRSWHEHNPFLSQKVRDKIEALKDIDIDLYNVYARGKTGKIEGLVFRNWDIAKEIPAGATYIGSGMDFGFTNDPTTIVDVWRSDGELWVEEKLYQTGLTNPDIYRLAVKDSRYVADSAEPKSIEELKRMGLRIEAAEKGKDSVNSSIEILKRYKIHLMGTNLIKEFKSYKWRVDKKTGQAINEPVDFLNHAIDALRYLAMSKLKTRSPGTYNISR